MQNQSVQQKAARVLLADSQLRLPKINQLPDCNDLGSELFFILGNLSDELIDNTILTNM
jgi:hypothetical protein